MNYEGIRIMNYELLDTTNYLASYIIFWLHNYYGIGIS